MAYNGWAIDEYLDADALNASLDELKRGPVYGVKAEALDNYVKNYFEAKCKGSKELTDEAKKYIPGGVQHNLAFNYPFPLAEFVFGSLADKWNQAGMPAAIDRAAVREAAQGVRLLEWQGESRKVYFSSDRGMLAFQGTFTYELKVLPVEMQQIFLLLAQFAEFSGVGRLTAQGFGAARVNFKL